MSLKSIFDSGMATSLASRFRLAAVIAGALPGSSISFTVLARFIGGCLSCGNDTYDFSILATQRVARAVKKAFDAPGVMIAQLNGPAAGQSVFHCHFHVLPRHAGLELRFHARGMADPALLAEHAKRVRAALD
jgi:hypothetical protein